MAETMNAVTIGAFGGSDQLTLETVPLPVPGPGECLVAVKAASVNPIDFKTRAGQGVNRIWGDAPFPVILGWDISGTVAEPGDTLLEAGDAVFGLIRFPMPAGAYAAFAAVPADQVVPKPATINHAEAAALPLAALTAWQALFGTAGLKTGQRVLIHAGAGGVGHLAVQLAKWKGAHVTATASGRNREFVQGLGADVFIDYTEEDFTETAGDMDVVFHTIAPDQLERSFSVLKRGGHLVSISGQPDAGKAEAAGKHGSFVSVRPNQAHMLEVAKLAETGRLVPVIDRIFPLADARAAHDHVEGGHTRGKVVLEVD